MNLIRLLVPAGWSDVVARTVLTEVAGFAALVLKEWLETREWDLVTCAFDAAWVAGGVLVGSALLLILSPRKG